MNNDNFCKIDWKWEFLNFLFLSGWSSHSQEQNEEENTEISPTNNFSLRNRQLPCNKRKYARKACNTK